MGKPQKEVDPFRNELAGLRKSLGNRIRELRQNRGWSQEDFAAQAHVHRTFAGSLERGEKNLSFHALVLIARSFGITASELLAGIESGEAAPSPGKRPPRQGLDLGRIMRELTAAAQSIQTAREIASEAGVRKSGGNKRRKP